MQKFLALLFLGHRKGSSYKFMLVRPSLFNQRFLEYGH